MNTPAVMLSVLALAVAAMLGLVVFSGRLPKPVLARLNMALAAIGIAFSVVVAGWILLAKVQAGEWPVALLLVAVWSAIAVVIVRERRRKPEADRREPGAQV